METIRELLRAGDSFAAIEHIQRQGAPLDVAAIYQSLLSNLYWKAHDLPAIVTIGRAGILYCLGQSIVEGVPPESVEKLRSVAKGLAYDVGSFSWPGWEEPGIEPTPADLAFGMECAKLNLRLAIELKKPLEKLSMAHWLVGAQALAARDWSLAEQHFQLAQAVLPAGDISAKATEALNLGCLEIARLGKNPTDQTAADSLRRIMEQLQADASDDAKSYLAQLVSARRIFAGS